MIKHNSTANKLVFQKINDAAIMPVRKNKHDAGLDLATYCDIIISAHSRLKVGIGLRVVIPHGYYGRIAPRSGNAIKYGIDVLGGVIDTGYRGEIGVILVNHGNESVTFKAGDRIAQLIVQPIALLDPIEGAILINTDRGTGGFGSTN